MQEKRQSLQCHMTGSLSCDRQYVLLKEIPINQSNAAKYPYPKPYSRYAPPPSANQNPASPIANPTRTASDDLRLRQLPLQQPPSSPTASTVVMAQERSGISVGLNKGHVRCPCLFFPVTLNPFFAVFGQSQVESEESIEV